MNNWDSTYSKSSTQWFCWVQMLMHSGIVNISIVCFVQFFFLFIFYPVCEIAVNIFGHKYYWLLLITYINFLNMQETCNNLTIFYGCNFIASLHQSLKYHLLLILLPGVNLLPFPFNGCFTNAIILTVTDDNIILQTNFWLKVKVSNLGLKCQYFVWPLLFSSTALKFNLHILSPESFTTPPWQHHGWFLGGLALLHLPFLKIPDRCSVGFKDGDTLGHTISFNLTASLAKVRVIMEVFLGSLLCLNTVLRPSF